jgi:Mg2+ and Co2+ transporter CorA
MAEATEETGYLHFVMTESILVSGRHHALCSVGATRCALEAGHRIGSAAALFETIIENVADTMDRVAERIAQSLDEIEEQVLSDVASDLRQQLGRLRRTCVRLHRQLSGLRIVFLAWSRAGIEATIVAVQDGKPEYLARKSRSQAATSSNRDEPLTNTLRPLAVIAGKSPCISASSSLTRLSST